jgi:hypothetical protein
MTGYLTDSKTAAKLCAALAEVFDDSQLPRFLFLNFMPVLSGTHAGKMFLPLADADIDRPIYRDMTLRDFPGMVDMIATLGGPKARVEIKAEDILAADNKPKAKFAADARAEITAEISKLPTPITKWTAQAREPTAKQADPKPEPT